MSQSELRQEIYLDNNATTMVLPRAAQAAQAAMEIGFGNPSSSHMKGLKAKSLMENTRRLAGLAIGAGEGNIIFNSGATEGIQTAILSALEAARQKGVSQGATLLYGATEHKAVPESLKHWNQILGIKAEIVAIPVDRKGLLDLDFVRKHVGSALMICTMAVNNETGAKTDLIELEKVIRQNNPDLLWMVDSVQALGKCDLDLQSTSIDYAPFSGHKLYALKGSGFLYVKPSAPLTPVMAGGGQEGGFRSGTENLPGMAALSAVFEMMLDKQDPTFKSANVLEEFRRKIHKALITAFPNLILNNSFDDSVATTINFSVPGLSSKELLDLFDAGSMRVSSGSACNSAVKRSYVLEAMGHELWRCDSAIRLSFGPAFDAIQIDSACERILKAGQALRRNCMILSDSEDDSESYGVKGLIQLKQAGTCSWFYGDEASKQCVLIDPVPELAERISNMLRCQKLTLLAILDTHGHADHVSLRPELKEHLLDLIPEDYQNTDNLGWPISAGKELKLANGEMCRAIKVGTRTLAKICIPGHTEDSSGYLLSEADHMLYAFLGDTILIGGIGRSNFKTSSTKKMYESLHRIKDIISEKTLICPTHDYNNQFISTLEVEARQETLLADLLNGQCDLDRFVERKIELDQTLSDQMGSEIVCAAFEHDSDHDVGDEIDASVLKQWLSDKTNLSLVDIRESHEHYLDGLTELSGHEVANIPLTRLSDYVSTLLKDENKEPVIFICRSGTRSKLASSSLRRLGLGNVTHVKGGFALT